MKRNNRLLGFAYALLAVTIWSGNFILASGLANTIPPIALAALRWVCATVVFLPFAWKHLRRDWPAIRANKLPLLAAAITGVTLFNTILYLSAHTTDTVNMALIASTTPVFVVILSRIFLGEPISYLRAAGLAVAITGMTVIATRGSLDILLDLTFREGDLWMLLAGLLWAVYSILVKRKPPEISQYSYLAVIFVTGRHPAHSGRHRGAALLPRLVADTVRNQRHPVYRHRRVPGGLFPVELRRHRHRPRHLLPVPVLHTRLQRHWFLLPARPACHCGPRRGLCPHFFRRIPGDAIPMTIKKRPHIMRPF